TEAKTVRTVEQLGAKVLIKSRGLSKGLVKAVYKDCDMTLLFILRRVMRRKFIGGSDQKFLEIGSRNFPPVVDISQRLFIADPISHPIGIDVGSNAALTAIIDHPILWHLGERA